MFLESKLIIRIKKYKRILKEIFHFQTLYSLYVFHTFTLTSFSSIFLSENVYMYEKHRKPLTEFPSGVFKNDPLRFPIWFPDGEKLNFHVARPSYRKHPYFENILTAKDSLHESAFFLLLDSRSFFTTHLT